MVVRYAMALCCIESGALPGALAMGLELAKTSAIDDALVGRMACGHDDLDRRAGAENQPLTIR